jgi:hypothetical protein
VQFAPGVDAEYKPPREAQTAFNLNPRARLKIIALEPSGTTLRCEAQFNPNQIQLDSQAPWTKQAKKGVPHLEYTGKDPRSMSFELFFDGFETNTSVQPELENLRLMLEHISDKTKRPPKVKVIWGEKDKSADLPDFPAVVASVNVKYTMFSPEGKMLRASASVKLTEAQHDLTVGKSK